MTDYRTSHPDVSRAIRSWLHEDRHEDVSRIAGAVLDQVEATPQRRSTWWPARRTPIMNKIVTIGLGAAAVVVALFIGVQLFNSPDAGTGAGDEPSPTPTIEPTPDATPLTSVGGGLPEGPHVLLSGEGVPAEVLTPPLTVTIPGPGWEGDAGGGILFRDLNDSVDPAGMIVFLREEYLVYGDPCSWESTPTDETVQTVDEFVAALAAQAGRDASEPVDITIDGYAGKSITLHIPDDADFSECDQGTYGTWNCDDPGDLAPCGFTGGPGETSVEYILDVGGVLVAWHTAYQAGTPADIAAELETLVLTASFGE